MTWSCGGNVELSVTIVDRVATIGVENPDWNGSETIVFTATDPDFLSDSDTVTFTVTPVNDGPVVSDIPDQTIAEGAAFAIINLDAYVSDVDHNDEEMTWSCGGNVELSVTIVDRVATVGIPDPDWNGNETIVFTATDPHLLSDSDTVTFTVTPVNDAPVVSDIPDQTIAEGEAFVTIDLDGYVSDVDNVAAEMMWVYNGNVDLMVTIDAKRVATITVPNADWNGTETIVFTATDPGLLSDSDVVLFTVTPVNDGPVAKGDVYLSSEGGTLTVTSPGVLANDTDPEDDALTTILVSGSSYGALSLNLDGSFVYVHDGSETVADEFAYRAYDGIDCSNVATVTIILISINDPPVAVDDFTATDEGTSVIINVLSNDFDPDGDTITISDYDAFSAQSGAVDCTEAGICVYSPPAGFSGTDAFTYTASDGYGGADTATVTINVVARTPSEHLVYLPLILSNYVPLGDVQMDVAKVSNAYRSAVRRK